MRDISHPHEKEDREDDSFAPADIGDETPSGIDPIVMVRDFVLEMRLREATAARENIALEDREQEEKIRSLFMTKDFAKLAATLSSTPNLREDFLVNLLSFAAGYPDMPDSLLQTIEDKLPPLDQNTLLRLAANAATEGVKNLESALRYTKMATDAGVRHGEAWQALFRDLTEFEYTDLTDKLSQNFEDKKLFWNEVFYALIMIDDTPLGRFHEPLTFAHPARDAGLFIERLIYRARNKAPQANEDIYLLLQRALKDQEKNNVLVTLNRMLPVAMEIVQNHPEFVYIPLFLLENLADPLYDAAHARSLLDKNGPHYKNLADMYDFCIRTETVFACSVLDATEKAPNKQEKLQGVLDLLDDTGLLLMTKSGKCAEYLDRYHSEGIRFTTKDLEATNAHGQTVLHAAIDRGVLDLLLRHPAVDVSAQEALTLVNRHITSPRQRALFDSTEFYESACAEAAATKLTSLDGKRRYSFNKGPKP